MNFERHFPRPPLAGLIDYLWHVSDAPAHARERILPSGTLEIVFNLAEDEVRIYDGVAAEPCRRLSGAVVSGVFSRFFVIDTREHACMVGVHFKPGGAFRFLRSLPAIELADRHTDLSALWGSKAPRLREALASAATLPQRFHLLEEALMGELGSAPAGHRAVPLAVEVLASGSTPVGALAACANLSHRRLIELFTLEVGATPKLFQRLRRFQRALELPRGCTESAPLTEAGVAGPSWAHVAQLAGYCDQSHWIRDCLSFSGLTPAQYANQSTVRVKEHHVALLGS